MTAEIEKLRQALQKRPQVELALLFGSRARGPAEGESDLDLAVVAPGIDRLDLAADLSLVAGLEVDVADLSTAGYPLLRAVVREGVCVFEKRPGALARWRARTIAQLETDRPWFERMRDAYLKRQAEAGRG